MFVVIQSISVIPRKSQLNVHYCWFYTSILVGEYLPELIEGYNLQDNLKIRAEKSWCPEFPVDFPLNQSTGFIPILIMIPCSLSSERRHRIHGLCCKNLISGAFGWDSHGGWVQLLVHSSASVL